ncbi:hypothetical protein OAT86_01275 [Planktomarina sp.]|nr:hypothetical protein [Planktomarina sp.]
MADWDAFGEGFASTFAPTFTRTFQASMDRMDDEVKTGVLLAREKRKKKDALDTAANKTKNQAESLVSEFDLDKRATGQVYAWLDQGRAIKDIREDLTEGKFTFPEIGNTQVDSTGLKGEAVVAPVVEGSNTTDSQMDNLGLSNEGEFTFNYSGYAQGKGRKGDPTQNQNQEIVDVVSKSMKNLGKNSVTLHSAHRGDDETNHNGNAFDIDTTGMSDQEKLDVVKELSANGAKGIGFGVNTIHVDTRGDNPRVWWYENGKDVTSLPDSLSFTNEVMMGHKSGAYVTTESAPLALTADGNNTDNTDGSGQQTDDALNEDKNTGIFGGFFANVRERRQQGIQSRILTQLNMDQDEYDTLMTGDYNPNRPEIIGNFVPGKTAADLPEDMNDLMIQALYDDPDYIKALEDNDSAKQMELIVKYKKQYESKGTGSLFGTSVLGGVMNTWIETEEGTAALESGNIDAITTKVTELDKILNPDSPTDINFDMANPSEGFFNIWLRTDAGQKAIRDNDEEAIAGALLVANEQSNNVIKSINSAVGFIPEDVTNVNQIPALRQKYKDNPAVLGQLDAIQTGLISNIEETTKTRVIATTVAEQEANNEVGFIPSTVTNLDQIPGLQEQYADNSIILGQLKRIENSLRLSTTTSLEDRLETTFNVNKELNDSVGFVPEEVTALNMLPGLRQKYKDNGDVLEQLNLIEQGLTDGIIASTEAKAQGNANVDTNTPKPVVVYSAGENGISLLGNGERRPDGLYINGEKVDAADEANLFTAPPDAPIKAERVAASDWIKKKNALTESANFAESALTYMAYYEQVPDARTLIARTYAVGDTVRVEMNALIDRVKFQTDRVDENGDPIFDIDRQSLISNINNSDKFAPGVKQILAQEAALIFTLARSQGNSGTALSNKDYDNYFKQIFNSNDMDVIRDNLERVVYQQLNNNAASARTIGDNPGAAYMMNQGQRWWDDPMAFAMKGRSVEVQNFVNSAFAKVKGIQQGSTYSSVKTLTADDIANSPSLQNLGASVGDKIIDGKLYKQ